MKRSPLSRVNSVTRSSNRSSRSCSCAGAMYTGEHTGEKKEKDDQDSTGAHKVMAAE